MKAPKHDTEAHLERTRARLARFGVDVRDDKKRGRCLVAAKDFKRGDLVLANAPYGLPVPMGDRCAGCFLKEDDDRVKMRCKACDMVWFCSERCMDGAMDGGHAVECAAMRRYFADDPDDAIRENGFVQFSALHRNCGEAAHPEDTDEPLDDHLPYLVPTAADKADTIARWALDGFPWREYCGVFAAEATAGARRCGLIPASATDETIKKEVVRSRMNDFFIQQWRGGDPELMAGATYPLGALLNHSCAPSCVCSYRLEVDGTRHPTWIQEFRCVTDVNRGTELTHAYVDASDWSNHRRAELLDRYGFVCACPRCPTDHAGEPTNPPPKCPHPYSKSGVAPPLTPEMTRQDRDAQMARVVWCQEACWAQVALEHDKRAHLTVKIAGDLIAAAESEEEVSVERAKAEKAADLLRKLKVDPDSHENLQMTEPFHPCPTVPMRIRALQMASNMAMIEQDFESSLRLGEELVDVMEAGYGTRWHARIANELVRLGEVAWDGLDDVESAAVKFREALEIGKVTCGPDSWLCERAKYALQVLVGEAHHLPGTHYLPGTRY